MNDQLSGIVGGVAGTAAMTVLLLVADAFSGFQIRSFEIIAALVGIPNDLLIGYLLFAAAGAIAWPLLFVALVQYLPGGSDPVRGMVFATVLWLSFALAFGSGLAGLSLVLYLVFTLIAHWVYGAFLGATYDRLADRTTDVV